jgi:hypothetical protein
MIWKAMALVPAFSWTYYRESVISSSAGGQAIQDMQEAARMGNREATSWLIERREKVDSLRSYKGG